MAEHSPVQSLDRAFDLLEILCRSRGCMTFGALSAETGLLKSTVHRLLTSMCMRGYVQRDAETSVYRAGMRLCEMPEDVIPAFELVKNEARKAFGNDDIFIEKYLEQPKHSEVQLHTDQNGTQHPHGTRDSSLQRRYQKVVEFAPAWSVPERIREQLHADAVKFAVAVGYVNAGTVEFLVDRDGNHYFIEMNPRIQVEHTVTEMVTSIDLVRAQILIAEGQPISHPEIGLGDQNNLKVNGYAIQCRVTTEDPANNFAPDNGKIEAYRSGGGFGVRLDGGNVGTG